MIDIFLIITQHLKVELCSSLGTLLSAAVFEKSKKVTQ